MNSVSETTLLSAKSQKNRIAVNSMSVSIISMYADRYALGSTVLTHI